MAKKKKSKSNEPEKQVALFVLEGSILCFNGTVLELHSKITPEEWVVIVGETIHYKIFLECLKETAFPLLKEEWTAEDQVYFNELNLTCSRMRNIDPLLVIKYDQTKIREAYTEKMKASSKDVTDLVQQVQDMRKQSLMDSLTTRVSNL